jgi:serine/threonine protein kinase
VLGSKKKTSSPQRSDESPDGISRRSTSSGRTNSFVGTEEYVAPEIVNGSGHEFSVDWWSLGILLYEMLYGKTPFRGSNKKETFSKILLMKPQITGPHSALHDLIVRLLEKEPRRRLGSCNGPEDVKGHLFFAGLRWDSIENLCRPPVVPDVEPAVACTDTCTLTLDMERFVVASHSGSECEETSSDSELEGLF